MNETLKQLRDLGFAPHPTQKGVLVSAKFMRDITAAIAEGAADAVHDMEAGGPGSGCRGSNCGRPEVSKEDLKWIRYNGYAALSDYQQNTFSFINRWLREGRQRATSYADRESKNLVSAISKVLDTPGAAQYTKQSMTVYRGIANDRLHNKFKNGKGKGTILSDKAFLSTSRSEDIASKAVTAHGWDTKGIRLAIRLPKGFAYLSGRSDEREMLLDKGLKLKVVRVDKYSSFSNGPEVTVVPVQDKKIQAADEVVAIEEAPVVAIYADEEATYPKDHIPGMRVPKGGSSCSSCEYLADNKKDCKNEFFQKWNGSPVIPGKIDEYCSDWFEPKEDLKAATENSQAGNKAGALWNGIKITGFTGPEETGLTAMMSRVPPELLTNVKEVKSAKELNAKHGRYIPETKVMLFNPKNFSLRQRYGQGDGWMYHAETTVVHEIGHSIYENLPPDKQDEWMKIGGWMKGYKEGQSPAYIERRPGWEEFTSPMTHRQGLKLPRYYSEKSQHEAFADCFAFYMLGKQHQMEPAIKDYMQQLIKDKVKKYPQASIESPVRP